MYLKAKSYTFPEFLLPNDYVQLCDVVIATMNSSELKYVKQECDRYKYHITVICDTKLLQLWEFKCTFRGGSCLNQIFGSMKICPAYQ